MSKLEPGLYRATVNSVADRIVLVDSTGWGYYTSVGDAKMLANKCDRITDARPLIVLDLKDPTEIARALRISFHPATITGALFINIADQIEAQTKPARIPEPGLWGVVKASAECERRPRHWLHDERGWATLSDAYSTRVTSFEHLIDPTLIHEGVS